MLHMRLPSDARIVDEIFSVTAMPDWVEEGWLLAMIATYGKTAEELKGFTWNKDNTINIETRKKPVRPLHPQWVFIFQLKEKQPSKLKSRWSALIKRLAKAQKESVFKLSIEGLLLAHKVRKVYYTPLKQKSSCLEKKQRKIFAPA